MLLWHLESSGTDSDLLRSSSEGHCLSPVELLMERDYNEGPGHPSEIYGDTDVLCEILISVSRRAGYLESLRSLTDDRDQFCTRHKNKHPPCVNSSLEQYSQTMRSHSACWKAGVLT